MAVNAAFFKQILAKCDTDMPGERHTAIDKAVSMCATSGISLQEAIEGAYASDDDDEAKELRERLEKAEEMNDQMADALRGANTELMGLRGVPGGARLALWNRLWTRPQTNLLVGFGLLGWRFYLGSMILPRVLQHGHDFRWNLLSAMIWAGIVYSFWTWLKTEFAANGEGTIVLKGLIIAFSIYMAFASYSGMDDAVEWDERTSILWSSILWIVAGCLLSVTSLCRILAESLASSKLLRGMFL